MIRKTLVTALAAIAFAGGSAAAADDGYPIGPGYNFTRGGGYLGVSAGGVIVGPPSPAAYAAAQLNGAATLPLGALNLEIEARGLLIFADPDPAMINAALLHAFWRNPSVAIGILGGPEPVAAGGDPGIVWHLGGEMQVYLNAVTLYLQAAKVIVASGGMTDTGWYARWAARFFPSSNVRLEAGVRVLGLDTQTIWTMYGEGEYQLPNSPLSVLATVRRLALPSGMGTTTATTAMVGFRFNFGGTLADQVAPMDTLPLIF
jgi:hypothetical protein